MVLLALFILKVEIIMVLAFDFLDSMAWTVAASGILLATGVLLVHFDAKSKSVAQEDRNLLVGFAGALGLCGLYLFVSGLGISLEWPFTISSGVYNVLFGGIATLGGLILLSGSVVALLRADPRPISYFAAVVGLYAVVDAYSIYKYSLTSSPLLAALGYLSFAAPAILSVPAAQFKSKTWKYLFALFALIFAAAWLYQAANFTLAHLQP